MLDGVFADVCNVSQGNAIKTPKTYSAQYSTSNGVFLQFNLLSFNCHEKLMAFSRTAEANPEE